MKKIAYLILFLSAFVAEAQNDTIPKKGDNVILIATQLSDEEAYQKVGEVLTDQGVAFKGDKEFKSFSTAPRSLKSWPSYQLTTLIRIQKGVVKMTGRLGTSYAGMNTDFLIEYRASGTSMHRPGFKEMKDIAERLKTILGVDRLGYAKQ